MHPEIIKRKPMTLVGLVGTGENVGDIDIAGLWRRFTAQEDAIPQQVDREVGYELHIHISDQQDRHLTLIGVEVEKIEALPMEMLAKIVPGGTYARFTHYFKDGGFGEAFKRVYKWVDGSDYEPAYPFDIQVYDARFTGAKDPDSVLEILVALQKK